MRIPRSISWLLALCLLAAALPAAACQICLPFPTKSLADYVLESTCTALAREDPDKPFTLKITEVLGGDTPDSEPDLFLDSHSRRILASSAKKSVVCVYWPNSDPPGWKRIGLDGGNLRPIVEAILRQSKHWTENPEDRPRYFAPYLGHQYPQISSLAHLEIARAPYAEIRKLAGSIPIEQVRSFLAQIRYAEWHALYILFLAQSDDPADQQRIIDTVESNARYSIKLQSAAWATALIEIQQAAALDTLDKLYFSNPDRSPDEIRAIHAACSVHGLKASPELQDRILGSYRIALETHPIIATSITSDLTNWKRSDLAEPIAQLLKDHPEDRPFEETLQLRAYLRLTETADSSAREKPTTQPLYLWLVGGLLLLPILLRFLRPART